MSINTTNQYEIDRHIAELYDRIESGVDDLNLIRGLIGPKKDIRILEPFCGTGRLLIPLASDGHSVCGLDQSQTMLDVATSKIDLLPKPARNRITLILSDVISEKWPQNYNLAILGCNCFYELASASEQQQCIQFTSEALKHDGFIFIDNDHMEGELDESWQVLKKTRSPLSGLCADGTKIESWMEPIWFDAPARLVKFRRTVRIISADGKTIDTEYVQEKHPVSTDEVKTWLIEAGFKIIHQIGDYKGNPYTAGSHRSIFWAQLDRQPP